MRMALSPDGARILNFAGMVGMLGVLAGAYIYQFYYRELPCTLCLLQRVAMLGVAFGAAMNLALGPHPRHYGICLISAIFGAAVSLRQTSLHINPYFDSSTAMPTLDFGANPAFGQPVFGFHLYVWGIILFASVIAAVGFIQLLEGQFDNEHPPSARLRQLATIGVGMLFAVALLETVTTFLECGFGDCPNDGSWNWWITR